MQQHQLSKAFPAMTEAEYAALVENIREHGQRHPIITYQGQILDGFHRARACAELNKEPYTKEYGGNDPAGYVLSSNLHRRHLSASQRAGAIVACNEWRSNGIRDQLGNVAELPRTSAQLAETAQVSERLIVDAKAAHKAGFGEAIRDGETTASEAANLARKAPEVAALVVAEKITMQQGKAELNTKVKRELPTVAGPDLNAELDRMDAQIMDMRAELIELRAASHDEQLRAQARDEIQGLREALALEQRLHAALKAQRETVEYQLNDWKKRCASLERQLERRERGE
jgi:ParB-like nuclease domain